MASKNQVNLLPKDEFEFSTTGKLVKWAVSVGRWVVVFTEFIVICAFLSRFYFDTELSNLFDELKQKQAIVESAQSFEENFRQTQNKTKVIKNLLAQESESSEIITDVSSVMPLNISLTQMSVLENTLSLTGNAFSEQDLGVFLSGLLSNPKLFEVSLTNVSSQGEMSLGITFNISAKIKK